MLSWLYSVSECLCTVGCLRWGMTITFSGEICQWGFGLRLGRFCSFVCVRCKITVGHRVEWQTFFVEFYKLWQCLLRWHRAFTAGDRNRFLHFFKFLNDTSGCLQLRKMSQNFLVGYWSIVDTVFTYFLKNWIEWIFPVLFRKLKITDN